MVDGRVRQELLVTVTQPATPWKTDALLDAPIQTGPEDGAAICPDNDGLAGANTGIILAWNAVAGATRYILQWCLNGNYAGPTVRSDSVIGTSYHIQAVSDIRMDDTIHWRVMAVDDAGGVSEKSDSRTIKYECEDTDASGEGDGKRGGPGGKSKEGAKGLKCKNYEIAMKIDGPKLTMCCDNVTFKLQLTWDCKDQFGREVLALTGTNWSLEQNGADANPNAITASTINSATVQCRCDSSQLVTIVAQAAFIDRVNLGVVFCEARHKFFIDCDTGKPEDKPWMNIYLAYKGPGLQSYIHPDYWRSSIAPHWTMTQPQSPIDPSVPVLYGGVNGAPNLQLNGGVPLGMIDITRASAMGPVIRFSEAKFPQVNQDQLPLSNLELCATQLKVGRASGERYESNTHMAFGCGIKVINQSISINNEHLVGIIGKRRGLVKYGTCSLAVNPGCGIRIDNEKVTVNAYDIAAGVSRKGIVAIDYCQLGLYLGNCLEFDGDGRVNVKTAKTLSAGNIWGVVPGSLSISVINCDISISLGIQNFSWETNDCGIMIGPITSGSGSTEVANATLNFTTTTDTWEVYECPSQLCITVSDTNTTLNGCTPYFAP